MSNVTLHQALIHIMVVLSAVDRDMKDEELAKIGNACSSLPVFEGYNTDDLITDSQNCRDILQSQNGLETVLQNAVSAIPETLYETTYALAVEIAAADLVLQEEELRMLQILRQRLKLNRLVCAAIEYSTRIRHKF